jgi:hypothetical protein
MHGLPPGHEVARAWAPARMHTAVLVALGLIGIQAAIALLICAHKAPAWIRKRRARRIEEAFNAGTFTVPTSWVREARRHRSAVKR